MIKAKKVAKKILETSRKHHDNDRYRQANNSAKKAVATTKALAINDTLLNEENPRSISINQSINQSIYQ